MLVALTQVRGTRKSVRRARGRAALPNGGTTALSLDDFETLLRRRALMRGLGESSPVIAVVVVGLLAFLLM